MKLPHYLALLLTLALPALGQNHGINASEWQRQQQAQQTQQQLDQQRQQLQLLQDQQRRAARDAAYCGPGVVLVPRRVTMPFTAQNRPAVNDYIQRVMADRTLNLDQKMRLIDRALGTPRP